MKKFIKENKIYLIMTIVTLVLFNVRLPYYISASGGVIDISDRIEYADLSEYDGSLNMLYVTEYIATIPTYLMSYVISDWELESIQESQVSNESMEEITIRNKIMLNNSINNAKYVAYTTAGKDITVKDKKHLVIGMIMDTNLEIGDEIVAVNNKELDNLDEMREIIYNSNVGEMLEFKVIRNGKEIKIFEKIKEVDGEKALGVILITNYQYNMSPEIELNFKKSESGSSGGLMMALSIYSAISGEDILKGRNIAGTGTIDINGNVGEIAGVKYKIMGAFKNNIDVVLVPSANYEEAMKTKKEKNYDLEIVEVNTFMDAINYLRG